MTPSTTDTTIPAPPERASSEASASGDDGQKRRRKRGGRRRRGSGGADGAAQSGASQATPAQASPAQAAAPAQDSPASGYSGAPAPAAPAAAPERSERSGERGESRGPRGDRPRRDDRGGKGRGERDRGHGRDRGGQGVDESYKERKHVEQPAGPAPEVEIPLFAALGLEGKLLAGVAAMGYSEPTPIQEHAIPRVLAGRDVVGCAQTGTGKTAAFVLPILQNMTEPMIVDGKKAHPTALVVTPTRELCGQIEEVGETLATYSGRRVVAVFGGVPYDPQAKRIRKGVDLLVATPGRLLDMLRQGDVLLDKVDTLVLDEADRMLDMGFWPDVKRIIDAIPARRQNLFFSATMSKTVLNIIADTLHDPIFIELGGSAMPVENVEQKVLPVNQDQKVDLLVEYFRHHDPERTLVFTRTRRRAERLSRTLNKAGISCEAIHGDRTQGQRQQALDGFKDRQDRRARGHRRGRARHRRGQHLARHQLRHPDQPRGLRAPHRAHGTGGGQRHRREPSHVRGRPRPGRHRAAHRRHARASRPAALRLREAQHPREQPGHAARRQARLERRRAPRLEQDRRQAPRAGQALALTR